MKKTYLGLAMLGVMAFSITACGKRETCDRLSIVHIDQAILGDAQKELGVSIGIKKGNQALQTALNTALATVTNETRTAWMLEAVDRAADIYTTTVTTPSVVSTDASLPVLTVGLECDYEPFNWTETTSNNFTYPIKGSDKFADGFDIQMARYLAATMNYRLEIVKLDWEALIPALDTGMINAVIAGMTNTEERRLKIDFSEEYYRSELVLVVRENSELANATSLEAFKGKRIVSQVSTVTNDCIEPWRKQFGVRHLKPMDTFSTCAIAVKNGTADAMTAELPVANAICNSGR